MERESVGDGMTNCRGVFDSFDNYTGRENAGCTIKMDSSIPVYSYGTEIGHSRSHLKRKEHCEMGSISFRDISSL